ncbi:MAG: endonuclease/exonuclease/phosphatase family protein [Planctomycetota bacterium]|nr:endonuclease/exonuclease/phosphatase family protein [Planctomycetota bacterium]
MTRTATTLLGVMLCWVLAACDTPKGPAEGAAVNAIPTTADSSTLRLMTFNIRYGTAEDGEHHWMRRRDHVLDAIAEHAPDVLAVQEALNFQVDAILGRMPWMQVVGEHRDGARDGEFSGLLVDSRRLDINRSDHFWLSETPQVPRSRSWDTALHRTASWAELQFRGSPDRRFVVLGTHLDHRGAVAREHSARLIVARLDAVTADGIGTGIGTGIGDGIGDGAIPCVVMGDFNAGESSAPMAVFRGAGFVDTFRVLHADVAVAAGSTGTFHAFRGTTDGEKIDGIWLRPVEGRPRVVESAILRPRRDGRPASDHDPVVAVVEW